MTLFSLLTAAAVGILALLAWNAAGQCDPDKPVARDCRELYLRGCPRSDVYTINPKCPGLKAFQVYCDMDNGGYTVFQRRQDGSVDFFRGWDDYVEGFGPPWGEHWLGLDKLYCLTSRRPQTTLRIDLGDWAGNSAYVNYTWFYIRGPDTNYTLYISGYERGSPYMHDNDRMSYSNGRQFSTKDWDNDGRSSINCASSSSYGGAWWYGYSCANANLNGRYRKGNRGGTVNWYSLHHSRSSSTDMKFVEMKLMMLG